MPLSILLILGALSALGPLAIDMYLPSFAAMATALDTEIESIQYTLAAYFVGLALGQLMYGPVVDRWGRRKPLLIGLTLFVLSSAACALSDQLGWLIAARFVQALGGCAGMVISRAVVRDICATDQLGKAYSQLMLVMGVAPILAPMLGGALLVWYGWHSIFWLLTLFSALCLLSVLCLLPETQKAEHRAASLWSAVRQYRDLLGDHSFLALCITSGLAMGCMFAYIAGSPFVFMEMYALSPNHYSWLFGGNAAGFILMSQINVRLNQLRGAEFWLGRFLIALCVLTAVILLVAAIQPTSVWVLASVFFSLMVVLGGILPNAAACAMAQQGRRAGSASAMMGSLQFTVAACTASLVGVFHTGNAIPLAGVLFGCALLATLSYRKAMHLTQTAQPDQD